MLKKIIFLLIFCVSLLNITVAFSQDFYSKKKQTSDDSAYGATGRGVSMPSTFSTMDFNSKDESVYGKREVVYIPLERRINPDKYVLGVGDALHLNIWGKTNISEILTVSPEGKLFFAKGGYLDAVGSTITEINKRASKIIRKFYYGVKFNLSLKTPRTFLISVVGAVANPGIYQALQIERVSEVIFRAGGLSKNASLVNIQIRRNGEVIKANMEDYNLNGNLSQNPTVTESDIVYVPLKDQIISASGEIKRIGIYELVQEEKLSSIIKRGGGVTSNASYQEPVKILRIGEEDQKRESIEVDLKKAIEHDPQHDIILKSGDEIFIPSINSIQKLVIIRGSIVGMVPANANESVSNGVNSGANLVGGVPNQEVTLGLILGEGETVRDIISRAGGITPYADLDGAYITRKDTNTEKIVSISVNLRKLVVDRDLSYDMEVKAGDIVNIPAGKYFVHVTGEIGRPLSVPFRSETTFAEYISLAGGPTSRAKLSRAVLVKKNGDEIAMKKNPMIEPGDTIFVPEIIAKFWQDYLTISMSITSLVMTFIAAYK